MKKILFIFLFILTGCQNNIEILVEEKPSFIVYAIQDDTEEVCQVSVDYAIRNEEDIFNLYTIYQNHLPLEYHSNVSPNTTLVSSMVRNKIIYYEVDRFIFTTNIEVFHDLLVRTALLYGYEGVHILFNDEYLI